MTTRIAEKVRDYGAYFILCVVQFQNWLAVAIGSIVLGLNEMYPGVIAEFAHELSPFAKLLLLAGWSGVVHFFLRQAKKTV